MFALVAASLALILSTAFFTPRLEVFARRNPHLQEWSRADGFMKQCAHPLTAEVEPALKWRLLPPLVCHALGLRGTNALFFPWIGLFAFLAVTAHLLSRATHDPLLSLAAVVGLGTTGGVVTATNWLGVNDGWLLLGVSLAVFGSGRVLLFACLLTPWVDERFLVSLPLLLLTRRVFGTGETSRSTLGWIAGIVGAYAAVRGLVMVATSDAASGDLYRGVLEVFHTYAAFLPLGAWMGLRALWIVVLYAVVTAPAARASLAVVGLLTLALMNVLAWDLSRSTLILLPLFLAGVVQLSRRAGPAGWGIVASLTAINLALPFSHVVGFTVRAVHGLL